MSRRVRRRRARCPRGRAEGATLTLKLWRHALADLGQRVVFGSDFPNIPYRYADAVRAVVDLGLGHAWVRGVLHDNAQQLFDLPPVTD